MITLIERENQELEEKEKREKKKIAPKPGGATPKVGKMEFTFMIMVHKG